MKKTRKPGDGLQPRWRQGITAGNEAGERAEHQSQQPRLLVVGFEQKDRQSCERKDQADQMQREVKEPTAQRFRRRRQVKLKRPPAATNDQFVCGSRRRRALTPINQPACARRFHIERDNLIADAQGCGRAVGVDRPDYRLAILFFRLPAALAICELLCKTFVKVRPDIRAHKGEEQDAGDQF